MKEKARQRNTRQRQAILEELRMAKSHPTASELHELVRKRLPHISLGTVYRNLELLQANQAVRKLEISGAEARFDAITEPHHHARCIHCGAVDDLHDIPKTLFPISDLRLDNYDLQGYRIEFYGLCARCRPS